MRIGVPKEIKPGEYRVGLTPTAVREYVAHGHAVTVEAGAGEGAGYPDTAYRRAGAKLVVAQVPFPLGSAEEVVEVVVGAVTRRTRSTSRSAPEIGG